MIFILLSICCSVTVGVLLKFSKRYQLSNPQAITFSYLFAIGLTWFFFEPRAITLEEAPTGLYLSLGFLLPFIFLMLANSVREYGIARTDIAQRLSLFLSLMASWLIFGESFSILKIAGLVTGLVAVLLILNRNAGAAEGRRWLYPLLVFLGFGTIDILFKQVAKFAPVPYTTSLFYIFITAFAIAIAYLIIQFITKKERFQLINFVCGGVLGLFNFGNILFYLKAHQAFADQPSTVFATMNLGVILLGTLIGVFIFKEKLTKGNYAGLILAVLAIAIITYTQLHAV